jgi:hypothetical protein
MSKNIPLATSQQYQQPASKFGGGGVSTSFNPQNYGGYQQDDYSPTGYDKTGYDKPKQYSDQQSNYGQAKQYGDQSSYKQQPYNDQTSYKSGGQNYDQGSYNKGGQNYDQGSYNKGSGQNYPDQGSYYGGKQGEYYVDPQQNNQYDLDTVFGNQRELKELFEAFLNKNNRVSVQELLDYLNTSTIKRNCSILIDKLNQLLKQKNPVKELEAKQFLSLFELDLADRENFKLVFNLVDQSRSDSIGIQELNTVNLNYELNLKKEDMQLMIENLKKSNLESVTMDELYQALYKFN